MSSDIYNDLNLNSNKIVNLTTPTADTDLSTKAYSEISVKNSFVSSSSDTTTDLDVAAPGIIVPIANTSTIVGDFTATTDGLQTDFNGVVLFGINILTTATTDRSGISAQLTRTRSGVTTTLGHKAITYIRNLQNTVQSSINFSTIQTVENGDVYEVTTINERAASTTTIFISGDASLFAIRIG